MNLTNSSISDLELVHVRFKDETPATVYFILLAICSMQLNGMSIYLTLKYDQLRVARMYIRVAYAIIDILFAISMAIHYTIVFNFPHVSTLTLCLIGDFVFGLFYSTTQLTAFIALERYFYFCKPMVYYQYFNSRSISNTSVLIFVISQGYFIIKEIMYGRKMIPLIGMCIFPYSVVHNLTNLLIFVLPAVIITLFSIYKIMRLLCKISVHPSTVSNAVYSEPMLRRRAAKKGLR